MKAEDAVPIGCLSGMLAGLLSFAVALVVHAGFPAAIGWSIIGWITATIGVPISLVTGRQLWVWWLAPAARSKRRERYKVVGGKDNVDILVPESMQTDD